jgi:hypothetical protein
VLLAVNYERRLFGDKYGIITWRWVPEAVVLTANQCD